MNFADISKTVLNPKGRFFQTFIISLCCFFLTIFFEINNTVFKGPESSAINYWYYYLILAIVFIALSIFIICFFTYPLDKNSKLLIVSFTLLTIGLLYWFHVLVPVLHHTEQSDNKILMVALISRLFSVIGFLFLALAKEKQGKVFLRRIPAFISIVTILLVYMLLSFTRFDKYFFIESEGFTIIGTIVLLFVSMAYLYIIYRSLFEYKKKNDSLYKLLSISFILMFFSTVSIISIKQTYDMKNLLSHFYQLLSYITLFNVFYTHGIKKSYTLLTHTQDELNGYLMELDELVDKRTTELRCINEKLLADQEIARGMQLSMLPVGLPKNEYVSFASGYIPAERLSGDFYNVFKIDETRFGICIGDVSGHGISAAMLSIFTFQKMQSLLEEAGGEGMAIPSLVLKHLYESFNSANFNEDMYIVMLYGVFDSQTGIFSYASGGLNTIPLRIRPDGSIQEQDNDGFAICKLGNLIKPKFVNHQILLFPGDKLVLYTDGLIDAKNSLNEKYTIQRLKKIITRQYKWGANRLTEAIVKDVENFADRKMADDVTILAIDVLPPF